MAQIETYIPDWRSEQEMIAWLGVDKSTLNRYRSKLGLAYTYLNVEGQRTLMYDRKQINLVLNKNSSYAVLGEKKLPL